MALQDWLTLDLVVEVEVMVPILVVVVMVLLALLSSHIPLDNNQRIAIILNNYNLQSI